MKNPLALVACVVLAVALVLHAPLAMQGARAALALCGNVIIPALYPFFVIAAIYVQLSGRGRTKYPGAGAMLLGLLGGYPVGAKVVAQLHARGQLTQEQAQRLQLFCVNAGPGFLIGAVGAGMLGNRAAGVVVLAALTVGSLLVGLCVRFVTRGERLGRPNARVEGGGRPRTVAPTGSLLIAVAQATKSIILVCGWVVLFGALTSLLQLLPFGWWGAIPYLQMLLEVSTGTAAMVNAQASLPMLAAGLAWGGLGVHAQVLGDVKSTGLPLWKFWLARLLHGGLAAGLCAVLVRVFPVHTAVSVAAVAGASMPVRLWAVSAPAGIALLIFCVFVILELDLRRKI
ncbi:MAG: hypothetical protein FWD06_01090 [Oscillospiraceae bacterium]|nr:hypothetical protein [Oscillospiraceae bacterium]